MKGGASPSGLDPRGLGLLLVVAALIRLPDLNAPFVFANDWSFAQFLVYARNYWELGPMLEWTIPCFGVIEGRGIVYANHPWLTSVLLGLWGLPFDYSEAAYRSLGLVFSLWSIATIAQVGTRLAGPRVGGMAAVLFAFTPLGIHFGRVYCMEPVHIAFLLLAYREFLHWRDEGTRYGSCLVYLALAQASDLFALFFCPWLFFLWLQERRSRRPRRDAGWWGLMATPVLVQAVLMAVVAQRALGRHTWERGVSRVGQPWWDWVDVTYWKDFAWKLQWNFGYLLPFLLILGWLGYRMWPSDLRQRWLPELGFWYLYPILYTLLGSEWMKHHMYLVVFWGPVLALHGGILLSRLRAPWGWGLVAAQSALSLWLASLAYFSPQPLHLQELAFASQLRQTVRTGDVVIGLPPHVAYYLNHKASVPYDYFVRRDLRDPEALNVLVRELVGQGRFTRVVICPRFIQYPATLPYQDLKRLYAEDSPLYRPVVQQENLLIWERTPGS